MRLYRVPEAAELLGCSREHVYALIKKGRLKRADIAIGPRSQTRISDAEIDRFIAEATRSTPTSAA